MKVKRNKAWLISFLMVFSLIMGTSAVQVYAAETDISVNILSGSEYLDPYGVNIRIDGTDVQNGTVKVEAAEKHTISILPQFGYAISVTINNNTITGVEDTKDLGWMNYEVAHADAYEITVSLAGNNAYTVVWDYGDDFGADAKVDNGTVEIVSAVLPDGKNGIGTINDQNADGGHVVIEPGSKVTVKLKPDYGYQFVKGSLNGQPIIAGEEVSAFTFIMGDNNLHLSALFEKTEDAIQSDSTQVSAASIANGEAVVDSGNLKLEITDLSQTEIEAADTAMSQIASDDEIVHYLNMDLFHVVNKGTETEAWENQLTNLDGELTVTLKISDELNSRDGTFYVIREHEEADGSKSYTRIPAVRDREAGTVTISTDKFSIYALALEDEATTTTLPKDKTSNAASPATGDGMNLTLWFMLLLIGGTVMFISIRRKHMWYRKK